MALKALRSWLAGGARPPEDAVLILAPDSAAMARAGEVIDALCAGRLRLSVVLIGTGDLAQRFPKALIRQPALPQLAQPVLSSLRARSVLALDPGGMSPGQRALLNGAKARGIPVFAASSADCTTLMPETETPGTTGTPADLAAHLGRAIGVERQPRWSLDTLAGWLARRRVHRATGGFLTRLDSLDALAARLGQPETILCLGNGPSSADPRLESLPRDALVRVNHDWQAKGYLTEPDLVVPGVKRSIRKLRRVPMVVANPRKEAALIAARLFELWHGPATYAVAEEIAALAAPDGPTRPTSGAYMLATAIALRPQRLIVAGMDLFQHPGGAYAGGAGETNAYTPSHDVETDAVLILASLATFEGELMVFSPALTRLIEAQMPERDFTLTDMSEGA